jgi:hypothetical protein
MERDSGGGGGSGCGSGWTGKATRRAHVQRRAGLARGADAEPQPHLYRLCTAARSHLHAVLYGRGQRVGRGRPRGRRRHEGQWSRIASRVGRSKVPARTTHPPQSHALPAPCRCTPAMWPPPGLRRADSASQPGPRSYRRCGSGTRHAGQRCRGAAARCSPPAPRLLSQVLGWRDIMSSIITAWRQVRDGRGEPLKHELCMGVLPAFRGSSVSQRSLPSRTAHQAALVRAPRAEHARGTRRAAQVCARRRCSHLPLPGWQRGQRPATGPGRVWAA